MFNRPVVAGVLLQTSWSPIKSVRDPFPTDLQNITTPKLLELESWHFEIMFTPHHVSPVRCHLSGVTVRCHLSPVTWHHLFLFLFYFYYLQSGWASLWRVCYQWGLPRPFVEQPGYAGSVKHQNIGTLKMCPLQYFWNSA